MIMAFCDNDNDNGFLYRAPDEKMIILIKIVTWGSSEACWSSELCEKHSPQLPGSLVGILLLPQGYHEDHDSDDGDLGLNTPKNHNNKKTIKRNQH